MAKRCELTGVGVMSGNNVSKSHRKTKRDFLPNLKEITFKSDALGVHFTLKVAANVLRTVNKYGSFDNFIINFRANKLTDKALKLRRKVAKALTTKGEYDKVRIAKRGRGVKKEN